MVVFDEPYVELELIKFIQSYMYFASCVAIFDRKILTAYY